MVEELEHQARKILDFLELEFEEQCLNFHQNKRMVRTASTSQVKQPIYRSSLKVWEAYKDSFGPLIQMLSDLEQNYQEDILLRQS